MQEEASESTERLEIPETYVCAERSTRRSLGLMGGVWPDAPEGARRIFEVFLQTSSNPQRAFDQEAPSTLHARVHLVVK